MKMKKKTAATKSRKTGGGKKPAARVPEPKKAVAKAPAAPSGGSGPAKNRPGTYTPSPVPPGVGWAPFRYPPQ